MEKIIIDEGRFLRTITRISHEIIEKYPLLDDIVLVGIKRRGAEIAEMLQQKINALTDQTLPCMALDITLYRDDLSPKNEQIDTPIYRGASHFIDLNQKKIILVDDVLFTGRTIRAALDALNDFGRPAKVELVIFVDRGHRELPIRADYVGKNLPTSRAEQVQVRTQRYDGCFAVALISATK